MDTEKQLETAIASLRTVIAGIKPEQLDNATPCANFDVRMVLGHFLGNLESVAGGLRGEPMPAELPPRPELLGDDPLAAYDKVMGDLVAATRTPGAMDRVLTVPFGEVPAPALVGFIAFDLVVHGWDLATATGQPYEPPADLVAEVDAFARQVVAPEWRDGDTFAAEVEPGAGAGSLDRLIAFSGRTP